MNQEFLEKMTEASPTRRQIVKTGAKLAYAAPLVAVSMKLTASGSLAKNPNQTCDPSHKTWICHRTCDDKYELNCVDNSSLSAHGAHECKEKGKVVKVVHDLIPALTDAQGNVCCEFDENGACPGGGGIQSL